MIEVPNLYNYYNKPEGLHFFEHVNHFSPRTLSNMAQLNGFELIEISNEYCSRDFGFVAVFQKNIIKRNNNFKDNIEYIISRNSIEEGRKLFEDYQDKINKVKNKISKTLLNKEKVLIWVANDITRDILKNQLISDNIKIVDSNLDKKLYLMDIYESQVFIPNDIKEYIKEAKLIIINSSMHAKSIINILERNYTIDSNSEIIITLDKY